MSTGWTSARLRITAKPESCMVRGAPVAPMSKRFIPLSVPEIRGNEWSYIKECLDTNWISYVGPFVERFEKDLAERCGAQHAVAMASGTAALHLALLLAG